jgi:hypothetical protein
MKHSEAAATPLLLTSALAWAVVLGWAVHPITALCAAAFQLAGQVIALRRGGHIGLSADPIAVPAGIAGWLLATMALRFWPVQGVAARGWIELALPLGTAWIAGHVAAMLAAVLLDVWRRRRGA